MWNKLTVGARRQCHLDTLARSVGSSTRVERLLSAEPRVSGSGDGECPLRLLEVVGLSVLVGRLGGLVGVKVEVKPGSETVHDSRARRHKVDGHRKVEQVLDGASVKVKRRRLAWRRHECRGREDANNGLSKRLLTSCLEQRVEVGAEQGLVEERCLDHVRTKTAKRCGTYLLLGLVVQPFVGERAKVDLTRRRQNAAAWLEEQVACEEERLDHALVQKHNTNRLGHDRVHLAVLEHCFLDVLVLDHTAHNSHLVGEMRVTLAAVRLVNELNVS